MADLYIIAAGNGSRLNSTVPKALIPITDEPCLTTTLQQIALKFRKVFVVTNVLVDRQWRLYFERLLSKFPEFANQTICLAIKSGLGDGHATLQGILAAEKIEGDALSQDIVVAWGDVFIPHEEIIDELLAVAPKCSGILPVVHENSPYVSLLVDENMRCISADFSKYGEKHAAGFHDQSVFRFDLPRLKAALAILHNALWKGGRYLTPAGELSLLYTFHLLYNSGDPAYVYQTKYPTRSFNTVEEVVAIQLEISDSWRRKFRITGSAHGSLA
jgi:bifunctional N-acetylglucosamine-1-phosphate-uridyltransferase/glucosamine-1-phosphate-acetyltransferase GlmU-like protein